MPSISTNNWDTAFGITFKDANAAIIAQGSSPAGFTGKHAIVGGTVDVTASFGPWQLSGGSDSLLQMTLPLRDGTVSGAGNDPADFTAIAVIQVSLGYIPQPGTATSDLKLNTGTGVSVLSVTLTSGPDSARDAVKGALQGWLGDNIEDFNHVFAAVDLNTQADTGEFAWLQPTHLGYALYTEGFDSVDDYLFGVLAMTEHRVGSRLSPEISPHVIPSGSQAGFLITAERIVEKMFLPNITSLFKNASADNFDTLDAGTTVYNTVPLNLPDFTLSDGTLITDAAINSAGFTLAIGAGTVTISFNGMTFTFKEGYTVTVNYGSVSAMGTDENGHLQLTPTGAPTVSVAVSESSSQTWKEIWEGIGISIAGAVIGAALGSLAEAALAAREAAAVAVAEGIDAAENGGAIELDLIPVDQAFSPADQVQNEVVALRATVDSLEEANAPMSFAGYFRANFLKVLGGVIGAAVGAAISDIPSILTGYADQDENQMPTLDDFAAKAIGTTTWADSSGYQLTSAALHGSLQFGLDKKA
jgi:hypothetical protein